MRTHAQRAAPAQARAPWDGGRTKSPGAAGGGASALEQAARRANTGPHAASLAAAQSVVAQRACADCEHVRRAMGGADPVQRAAKGSGGLPDGLRAGLEQLSGRDLSGVSVHYDSPRPAQLNAHAFAQGSEIHVAPGQDRHLPHEGWHAVQQMQNRVRPTMSLGGTPVNDSAQLEREADVMGTRAARMGGAVQRAAVRGEDAGAAPARRDAARASSPVQLNGGKKGKTPDDSGKQDNIQRKMATLVGMYRENAAPGTGQTELEERAVVDGLCGGWVQVFRKYPEWTEELWAAMKEWEVPDEPDPADHRELLDSLNALIATHATRASGIRNVRGQEAFMQVIQLLREAWQGMASLEPHNYDESALPDFTEHIATDRGEPAEHKLVFEKTIREKKNAGGAEATAREIQRFVEQRQAKKNRKSRKKNTHSQLEFTAHIETDTHHMAVRVRTTSSSLAITVVETENLGIETLSSWDQLATYLAGGFFFGEDPEQTTEEVEIRIYAPA